MSQRVLTHLTLLFQHKLGSYLRCWIREEGLPKTKQNNLFRPVDLGSIFSLGHIKG